MSQPQDDTHSRTGDRVPRRFWVGLLALVIYILFAAVLGNITGSFAPEGDVMAERRVPPRRCRPAMTWDR
ncbi:hypothetical protein [Microbacterium sp. Root280D1]|uniref:hypothetical protein n=1 Tax=Microbacterium sp. Root280D1 TaxID=1736510 RepID=UPI00138F7DF0|nr:hypothetical protein [Microbacterium sp. Root280D1]